MRQTRLFPARVRPVTADPGAPPAWIATAISNGWGVCQWATISGASPTHGLSATNVCFDVAPAAHASFGNQAAVMSGYCGATLAHDYGAHGSMITVGGGHDDYQGNEVYCWDIETRTWTRLSDPYSNPARPYAGLTDWWPAEGDQVNGSPVIVHTYDKIEWDSARNSVFIYASQTNNGSASQIPIHGEFVLSTGVWTKRSQSSLSYGGASWAYYDSIRDLHISHGDGGGSWRTNIYNPVTDGHTDVAQAGGTDIYTQFTDTVAAHDTTNDIVVLISSFASAHMVGIDASDLSSEAKVLTMSGNPSLPSGNGWEYSSDLGGFVFFQGATANNDVYLVTKGSGTWDAATWTWTNLLDGGNTVTPESNESAGVYSKFRIKKHGSYVIAYLLKRTGQTGLGAVYGFRLT